METPRGQVLESGMLWKVVLEYSCTKLTVRASAITSKFSTIGKVRRLRTSLGASYSKRTIVGLYLLPLSISYTQPHARTVAAAACTHAVGARGRRLQLPALLQSSDDRCSTHACSPRAHACTQHIAAACIAAQPDGQGRI
jgi:hypothetical protein